MLVVDNAAEAQVDGTAVAVQVDEIVAPAGHLEPERECWPLEARKLQLVESCNCWLVLPSYYFGMALSVAEEKPVQPY